jgi:predicted MPP superfamily phosphohydrolase
MFQNQHLWPILVVAALGFVVVAGAWALLLRKWPALKLRWWWAGGAALLTALYLVNLDAWLIEPESLVVHRVEIASPSWHGAPLTIAAIGDTHVGGPHMDAARMGRVVARINALHPDLVVLLGDYEYGSAPEAERTPAERREILGGIATFAALDSRYGAVAALGNHDGWYDHETIMTALQDAGVAALWDRNIVIHRSGGPVVIAGLSDKWTGSPNFTDALDGAPGDADTIIIEHNPDVFAQMPPGPALMLAGHTHCGQVTLPFFGRIELPIHHREYACGRVDNARGQTLFVTAGVGTSILPVRFGNPPEIALITIRSAR